MACPLPGSRGGLTTILRGLSQLELEQRREVGALGNRAKSTLEEGLEQRNRQISEASWPRLPTWSGLTLPSPAAPWPRDGSIPPPRLLRR